MSTPGYVYMMSNRKNGVVYIGVTSDLIKRIYEHKHAITKGFTTKYNATRLVYYEQHSTIETAIAHEKKLKNLSRAHKIAMIKRDNPHWNDLYDSIL